MKTALTLAALCVVFLLVSFSLTVKAEWKTTDVVTSIEASSTRQFITVFLRRPAGEFRLSTLNEHLEDSVAALLLSYFTKKEVRLSLNGPAILSAELVTEQQGTTEVTGRPVPQTPAHQLPNMRIVSFHPVQSKDVSCLFVNAGSLMANKSPTNTNCLSPFSKNFSELVHLITRAWKNQTLVTLELNKKTEIINVLAATTGE